MGLMRSVPMLGLKEDRAIFITGGTGGEILTIMQLKR